MEYLHLYISIHSEKKIIHKYIKWKKHKKNKIKENKIKERLVGWLVGFYGISTFVGYLTPNPFLYKESVHFQTIQFSMSIQLNCQKHFYFKPFSLVWQFKFKQFSLA